MKICAALFDLDGLMLDTERPFLTALQRKAREAGWDIPFELLKNTIGINCRASEHYLKEKLGEAFPFKTLRGDVIKEEAARAEHYGIPRRPGLIQLLDALADKKIPAAVATSTDRERALWKLKYGGILERFNIIVCGDEIENGKPAPDIFLKAAEKLGEPAENCAGFEDSPAGLMALAAGGIRSIFIKDLVEPDEAVLATVWKRLPSLYEAIELF
ncbi:MAG: HAD family phosphatase [Spirochaetaceae bacterium]|jgi:HAD superfamily hydrolase (TIGR01509 family)|nr:HAD family phosphatase [Spirochaetaceae bacterium]